MRATILSIESDMVKVFIAIYYVKIGKEHFFRIEILFHLHEIKFNLKTACITDKFL